MPQITVIPYIVSLERYRLHYLPLFVRCRWNFACLFEMSERRLAGKKWMKVPRVSPFLAGERNLKSRAFALTASHNTTTTWRCRPLTMAAEVLVGEGKGLRYSPPNAHHWYDGCLLGAPLLLSSGPIDPPSTIYASPPQPSSNNSDSDNNNNNEGMGCDTLGKSKTTMWVEIQ